MMPSYRDGWTVANPSYMINSPFNGAKLDEVVEEEKRMSRLIDADALMDVLGIAVECKDCSRKGAFGCKEDSAFVYACEAITDVPTIDAVPVVRCRNCECWYPEEDDEYGHCRKHDFWTSESWFCADGERRDDGKH